HSPRAEESDDRVPGRRRASRLPEGFLPDERAGASRPLRERTQGREGEVLQGGLAAMGPPKRDADEAGRLLAVPARNRSGRKLRPGKPPLHRQDPLHRARSAHHPRARRREDRRACLDRCALLHVADRFASRACALAAAGSRRRPCRPLPPHRLGAWPQCACARRGGAVTAEVARVAGPVAAAGLAILYVAPRRDLRLAGLIAWAAGCFWLAYYLAPRGHLSLLAGAGASRA